MNEKMDVIEVDRERGGQYLMLVNIVCPACGSECLVMHAGSKRLKCEICGQRYEGLADLRMWKIAIEEQGRSPELVEKWGKKIEGERKVVYEQYEK